MTMHDWAEVGALSAAAGGASPHRARSNVLTACTACCLQFVFRQGSPLDPAALRMVAAADAQHIIVCGDGRWAASRQAVQWGTKLPAAAGSASHAQPAMY